jgi:hypothetical protein
MVTGSVLRVMAITAAVFGLSGCVIYEAPVPY